MTTKTDQPMRRDEESRALYKLYIALRTEGEAAKERRVAAGRASFGDLDDAGRREYKRRKQAEYRARRKGHARRTGAAPLDAASIRGALADAAMLMVRAGDKRVEPILELASRAFEIPPAAKEAIRRRASKHTPKTLTSDQLRRTLQ